MSASIVHRRGVKFCRYLSHRSIHTTPVKSKAVILGVYKEKDADPEFTIASTVFNEKFGGELEAKLKIAPNSFKAGGCRVLMGLDKEYDAVALVCLGKKDTSYDSLEVLDSRKENVRKAVAAGISKLQSLDVKEVEVDPCGDPEAAAEGSYLKMYSYDELKAKDKRKLPMELTCYLTDKSNASAKSSWKQGQVQAEGQNLARKLMEMPSNKLTPRIFASIAQEKLQNLGNTEIIVRDQKWAEDQNMGAFLCVSKGSQEPLVFLEVSYQGAGKEDLPVAIVGKGVTFDSGGISIKPSASMDEMRADMGGAACTLGAIYAAAKLRLPINIKGFMPLCENMPSGTAVKPGDVVTAMNGKTIQVDNTDAEGRLILADALCYAETFQPKAILDMATLTGAIDVALGAGAAAVFTNSSVLWSSLEKAGSRTGDRVWRMPLWDCYTKQITESQLADLNNISGGRSAGACTAAAFLKEFVKNEHWAHLDIAGVMKNKSEISYLNKGMAGRPTRTIIEFLRNLKI
ncbi:cytosol aminopeptidase-like [Lingula anatina]|uniref:Cytosol aminopeptidase n=1 Tax=Lingula anatina TaxID=7574 RepID=A0A1S3KDK2_LINAN|nr:cytosol aminopeptidase-like [Lingula anatina]|eukprot:XP_013420572.1 cytosol aminopeptidase-like [Lingula anatina]